MEQTLVRSRQPCRTNLAGARTQVAGHNHVCGTRGELYWQAASKLITREARSDSFNLMLCSVCQECSPSSSGSLNMSAAKWPEVARHLETLLQVLCSVIVAESSHQPVGAMQMHKYSEVSEGLCQDPSCGSTAGMFGISTGCQGHSLSCLTSTLLLDDLL
jgi:hypothetical protein